MRINGWARLTRIALLTVLALIGISGCRADNPGGEPAEVVYGLTLTPSGIDPHIHSSSELGIPLRSVYDTLIYRDPATLEFVPGLAESWQVSADGLIYTFVLRDDVRFHDGTPFNADAVRVNLERIMDPANNSLKARELLGPLQRIEVHDMKRISLFLSQPYVPFLDALSQPYIGIASPAALAQYDAATYQFHQVGTGPYRFVEYIPDDRLVLERNPEYAWGPSFVSNPGVPQVERLVFRFYTDTATRALALESGEAQVMGELLPTDARRLTQEGVIDLAPVPIPGQPLQFLLNTTRAPTSELAVRQALIRATDRQTIVQAVFQGYSPVAQGPLSAVTLYYSPEVEQINQYDPVQAVALFNSTGWVDTNQDGWRDQNGVPLVVDLVTAPWGLMPEVAQLLKSQWEDTLDVQVRVLQVASFTMLNDVAASNEYNAIGMYSFGLDPSVLNAYYLSTGRLNWSHVSNVDLDSLLLAGLSETNPEVRASRYAAAQRLIMEQALVLPIRDYVNLNGYQHEVQRLHFDAMGWFPLLADLQIELPEQP